MIDKATFEAHVRAEAEAIYTPLMEGATIYDNAHDANEPSRLAYIAARMKHEWPLVEALQNISLHAEEIGTLVCNCGGEATLIETLVANALSPYTTKPSNQ